MSAATRQRVFEAFFTTKEATGTGLGLWVSEEIVRKHSGSIRVKSRQGQKSGTCFMLFLPDTPSVEVYSVKKTVVSSTPELTVSE
jgi:signal transduction histidine kinase